MQNGEGLTAERITEFLKGSEGVNFAGQNKKEVYAWIQSTLVAQEYTQYDKKRLGTIRAFVEKVTGLGQRAGDPADTDVQRNRASGGASLPTAGESTQVQRPGPKPTRSISCRASKSLCCW